MSEQINSLKNMQKKKKPIFSLEEETAATVMTKQNAEVDQPEKKRLSVHVSSNLELEFKNLSKRLGITVSELLNEELEKFFNEGASKRLLNDYVEDESTNRSYNIDAHVKQQLEEYCVANKRTQRFVVEAILSSLVKEYK